MGRITINDIRSSSDDELFSLLGKELEDRVSSARNSPEFVAQIANLPVGLRAMAATYELDVSLSLDDLGWHFANWHDTALAEETANGLEELGASELATLFREAFRLARDYWTELGAEGWTEWYNDSPLYEALTPLNSRAWSLLDEKTYKKHGVFKYWIDYARRHPDRIGVDDS